MKSSDIKTMWSLLSNHFVFKKYETLKDANYSIVYTYNGTWLSYVPNRTFNSLTTLKPGYGYWVNVNENSP